MTTSPDSAQTLTTSSAVYIQHPRVVTALHLLWLVVAALLILMYAASIPVMVEKLTVLCSGADCALLQLQPEGEATLGRMGLSLNFYTAVFVAAEALVIAAYVGIGSMIFWRKPLDLMVVVFSFVSVTWISTFIPSLVLLTEANATWHLIKLLFQTMGLCLGVLFILLFPDGRFFPPWTRWYFLLAVGVILFGSLNSDTGLMRYIFQFWDLRVVQPEFFLILMVVSGSNIIFQVQRYRTHSTPLQQQQTKWVIAGLTILIGVGFVLLAVPVFIFPGLADPSQGTNVLYSIFTTLVFSLLLILFPVSVMFSALRYRLWDVDVVLNRTLVYGLVTLVLVLIFAVGLLGVRSILTLLVEGDQLTIALPVASVIAALAFNPTRKRVQHLIDRRIYGLNFDLNELKAAQKSPDIQHPGALSGRKLGAYDVLDAIGKGGMGEVYKAQADGQTVALKILPDDLAQQEHFRKRFEREVQTLTVLHHPNIVRMVGAGTSDGIAYLAMEFIHGEELGQRIKNGALSLDDTRDILRGLASALEYAHGQGFVHRDIKPSNIMLRRGGDGETWEGVLMDFGIAKIRDSQTSLTGTGAIGTIDYMAPEQIISAAEVDHRADIYALGIVAYEMLTGERPYKGGAAQVMFAHLQQPAPDPREVKDDLSSAVAHAIQRAMEKQPNDRFATVGEFVTALA